jgi:hypothetical protein
MGLIPEQPERRLLVLVDADRAFAEQHRQEDSEERFPGRGERPSCVSRRVCMGRYVTWPAFDELNAYE